MSFLHLLKISPTAYIRPFNLLRNLVVYHSRPSNINNFSSISAAAASANIPCLNQNLNFSSTIRRQQCLNFSQIQVPKGDCTLQEGRISMIPNSPWAVINIDDTTKLLFFVNEKLFYPVRTPIPTNDNVTRCFGSSGFGWLALGDTFVQEYPPELFLFNPVTDTRIQLPPYLGGYSHRYSKVVLLSDPDYNDRALVACKDYEGVFFHCRLGDEHWNVDQEMDLSDIIFYKGVIYAVSNYNTVLLTIQIGENGMVCERPLPVPFGNIDDIGDLFLVESEGELLLVTKRTGSRHREYLHHRNGDPYYVEDLMLEPRAYHKHVYNAISFHVFKLDFETRNWVELGSLGDRMLLVDCACSVSVDATKFLEFGFKPNCIYYTDIGDYDDYMWHEFCLKDGKIRPFGGVDFDFSTILPIPPLD